MQIAEVNGICSNREIGGLDIGTKALVVLVNGKSSGQKRRKKRYKDDRYRINSQNTGGRVEWKALQKDP
jgi:hypothetical protein